MKNGLFSLKQTHTFRDLVPTRDQQDFEKSDTTHISGMKSLHFLCTFCGQIIQIITPRLLLRVIHQGLKPVVISPPHLPLPASRGKLAALRLSWMLSGLIGTEQPLPALPWHQETTAGDLTGSGFHTLLGRHCTPLGLLGVIFTPVLN